MHLLRPILEQGYERRLSMNPGGVLMDELFFEKLLQSLNYT